MPSLCAGDGCCLHRARAVLRSPCRYGCRRLSIQGGRGKLFAHQECDLVSSGAGRVEVTLDAPDIEAVAQVELDGWIVNILRLQHNRPTATSTRPISGAGEEQ